MGSYSSVLSNYSPSKKMFIWLEKKYSIHNESLRNSQDEVSGGRWLKELWSPLQLMENITLKRK